VLGFTHAKVGGDLGRKWRLPEELIEAIEFHERPTNTGLKFPALLQIVGLANLIMEAVSRGDSQTALDTARQSAAEYFEIRAADMDTLIVGVSEDARSLSNLLNVNIGGTPDISSLLEQADEARIQQQLEMQRQSEELERSNSDLAKRAYTDGLTGAHNRKKFDEAIAARFEVARSSGGTLAIIMIDADRFKSVNDTLGHQAGDEVLIEIARRVQGVVQEPAIACRYGGEEFVVLAPDLDRRGASRLAEAIRAAISASPISLKAVDCGKDDITVTASLGVSVLERENADRLSTPVLLTQAADRALYAAKQAGRNCVRVFTIKPVAAAQPMQAAA